jgi:Fe-S oxidoreductase
VLVEELERGGGACELSAVRCCGAPWLHAGDVDAFAALARRNVAILAAEIRAGTEVVVARSPCHRVIVEHYPDHLTGADVELVCAHTHDAEGPNGIGGPVAH